MSVIKCKMCGGDLELIEGSSVAVCEYCGSQQTVPAADNEKKLTLFARANRLHLACEFDKAAGVYESIVADFPTEAEAYWSLVLCRYGIEYVEDPATHKRVPTVNRAQYTSIFDDEDYKAAIQYADAAQRVVYEAEAKAINEIQKGILEISQKEEPFDVFICYKETDANGRRTPDSVLATDLYHQLTQEGFKVFFSRITLEDKLGTAYEPYIFAALNSAKVMVVLGTKPEYFNAVWVKNEWSRYLALIRGGARKVLIPAYRDMDPYDLPEEFSHLQAQDMSELGFMQDLIRGIKKLCQKASVDVKSETVVYSAGGTSSLNALIDRGNMALEDAQWEHTKEFFDQALNLEAHCGDAYLGLLLASVNAKNIDAFSGARLNQYQSLSSETIEVREDNTTLIEETVDENAVPGFLSEEEIRNLFAYSFQIESKVSTCIHQYETEEQYLRTNNLLNRAKQFLSAEKKDKLNKQIEIITKTLSDAIEKEKEQDSLQEKRVRQAYEAFCGEVAVKVCALASDARSNRDTVYTDACSGQNQKRLPAGIVPAWRR